MNNRNGFTLIELLATLILLSIVGAIAGYSTVTIINNSKEKNYELLVDNIYDAAELYYQECKYSNNTGINCNDDGVTLGELVKFGYLKGNSKKSDNTDEFTIINPKNDGDISNCKIKINMNDNTLEITTFTGGNSDCPIYNR